MKKLIALLMAMALVLGLVACGTTPEAPAGDEGGAAAEGAKKTIYVLVPNPDHGWTGAIGVAAQERLTS